MTDVILREARVGIRSILCLFCYLFCCSFAVATDAETSLIFVRARLQRVESVSASAGGPVSVDGTYALTFAISQRMVGHLPQREFTVTTAGAQPVPGVEYYVLAETAHREVEPLWLGVVSNGICIDEDTLRRFGAKGALKRLREEHPCK
jgi:hypothetical protein